MTKLYFNVSEIEFVNYFKELTNKFGIELTEVDSVKDLSGHEILLSHLSNKNFSRSHANIIVFGDLSSAKSEDYEALSALCEKSNILGWIDTSLPSKLYTPLFRTIEMKLNERNRMIRLAQMSEEIGELTEQMDTEIKRVKKIHERIVPVRHESTSNFEIFSKYAAGESSGGEFFDFFSKDGNAFIIMSSSTSYLTNNFVINAIENLKLQKLTDDNIKKTITDILIKINVNDIRPHKARNVLDLIAIRLDLVSMTVHGYKIGDGEIISSSDILKLPTNNNLDYAFLDNCYFSFPLKNSDKLMFLSSGIKHNTDGKIKGKSLTNFIKGEFNNTPHELLNELFFQLKKDINSDFLKYDASAIYIEVKRNGIFKI